MFLDGFIHQHEIERLERLTTAGNPGPRLHDKI